MAIIHVSARQHWNKSAGWTRQSVRVWVDGVDVGAHELTSSRERSGAIELALVVLDRAGFPVDINRSQAYWGEVWERAGHTLTLDMCWVSRKADAHGVYGAVDGVMLWRVWRDGVWVDALDPAAAIA
jgi:uncharacterized membrane protein (DUF2068 family)